MQSSLLEIAEVQLILCKGNANRMQSSLLEIAEVQLILCKGNANRMQSSLLGIAEVQLILCKDIKNPKQKGSPFGIFYGFIRSDYFIIFFTEPSF